MKWFIKLNGDNFDMEELPKWLADGEYSVHEEDGKYFLTSIRFDEIVEIEEVKRAAEEILKILNGLGRLQWSEFQPVELGAVETRGQAGSRQVFLGATAHVRVRGKATVVVKNKEGEEQPSADLGKLIPWVKAVEKDELLQRALGYLNRAEITWNDLYRAVEVVESDVGRLIIKNGWTTRAQLSRFQRTANSYSILGYSARHGKEHADPPTIPMKFSEARQLVLDVVRRWIESKVKSSE